MPPQSVFPVAGDDDGQGVNLCQPDASSRPTALEGFGQVVDLPKSRFPDGLHHRLENRPRHEQVRSLRFHSIQAQPHGIMDRPRG
ncbi:hypothetical protein LMG22931_01340 [Paraburkholderia nemoris]|nr:hypothetical protein LMG22931_01340 [Paraburkholderia nemoris]